MRETGEALKKTKLLLKGILYDLIDRLADEDQKRLLQSVEDPECKKNVTRKELVFMVLYARALKISMKELGLDPEEDIEYENYLIAIVNMKLEYSDEEMVDVIRRVFLFKPATSHKKLANLSRIKWAKMLIK